MDEQITTNTGDTPRNGMPPIPQYATGFSHEDDRIINSATNEANSDLRDIERDSINGKIIHIDWEAAEKLASNHSRKSVPSGQETKEYTRQRTLYEEIYMKTLKDGLHNSKNICCLDTPQKVNLQKYAKEDRDFQRTRIDINSVLRSVQAFSLSIQEILEKPELISDSISFYQDCYSFPREVVKWPSFRDY